ncbi:MAG: tRNA dihydrouridine synthase DusB [Selenomonadaceae bacterium]|nr:tRNA dihydrouridine synthase DusB [Selenomonadaceae bacterium]MBQ1913831.1 tRNA dihydrouridine synthase DusB [Selenomonadaceae bacterium]
MRIGSLEFDAPVFLAPMAGVTDIAYRILAHDLGCPLCYAEMVSVQGIHYRNERTLSMLHTEPGERPIAIQLFGPEPDGVAEGAKYLEDLGTADIIDFNMGCPAPKIVNNGEGSALMKDPKKAFAILKALRKAVKLPVTVKMRKGWDDAHVNAVEMAKLAEEAGVDAIAVHGRTREQFYSGRADWDIIAQVKEAVHVPVIANGDVRTIEDLEGIRRQTGCDGVMIGRAAQGNPWIFRQFTEYLRTGKRLPPPTMRERADMILRHLDLLLEFKGDYIGPREMRKHATWYTKGQVGGAELRNLFNRAETREDFVEILQRYFYG